MKLKPIVFKEAIDFVREQSTVITDAISKQHRGLVKEFIEYREETEKLIREREYLLDRWQQFEKAYVMRSPTLEAEHAFDSRSPLNLYSCVIPQIKEHRKLEIDEDLLTSKTLIDDIKAQRDAIQLQKKLQDMKISELKAENMLLSMKNEQLEAENA